MPDLKKLPYPLRLQGDKQTSKSAYTRKRVLVVTGGQRVEFEQEISGAKFRWMNFGGTILSVFTSCKRLRLKFRSKMLEANF